MPSYRITGGKPLTGEVQIAGAKNSASKLLFASLLTDEPVTLKNVPKNEETSIAIELVKAVGNVVDWTGDHEITAQTKEIKTGDFLPMGSKNRLGILLAAPLLHRHGSATVPRPSGDKIGPRPVNFHIDTLVAMGAAIAEVPGGLSATVEGRLSGTVIDLPYPSVGATETGLYAGVLAAGRTVINNAAIEPEIMELIMLLQNMGAIIQTNANRTIEMIGVETLHGATQTVIPDRMEAASFACMALGTRGDITVRGARQQDMVSFLNAVRKIGGEYQVKKDGIRFFAEGALRSIELETDTFPGFSTDWQQPFVAVLTQAKGTSVVHETVYEERFGYTKALVEMGADIALSTKCLGEIPCRYRGMNYKHSAVITGPRKLHPATVTVPDIRAGLAYVIAALMADGESTLNGIEHLDRGYEALDEKLKALGAIVTRTP
ncbi:UDP-N-acetylglucosamine 1-carboxyvinyltransferase [Candidatus Uhrbacteria bacterium]|nr:UDP-N-acetylglucosamine 1-carboxyvinyltransferase [Candidatus Uhrbacteria bacterium]